MLLALVPAGGHIVTTTDCYRRTRQFIQTVLPKMGISATVIEPSDMDGLERVRRDLASFRVEYQKPIADPEYHRTRFCLKHVCGWVVRPGLDHHVVILQPCWLRAWGVGKTAGAFRDSHLLWGAV